MTEESITCDPQLYGTAESVFLRVFGLNGNSQEYLGASSPIAQFAAADIVELLEQPYAVKPDVDVLRQVIRMPGKAAWASATAPDAQSATRLACSQQDMKAARGVLVVISLSPDSSIVASIKAALTDIYRKTSGAGARTFAVAHDETLEGGVRVGIFLTGL